MKCKDCKHWQCDLDEHGFEDHKPFGKCKRIKTYWDSTEWQKTDGKDELGDDAVKRVLKDEYADELAFAQDGSDYWAELITLPNFGCVQFEDKT